MSSFKTTLDLSKAADKFLLGFGILSFIYILVRCFTVSPFVDEILNYHMYARRGEMIPFYSIVDANNHFVSTVLNYISCQFFGSSVPAMRIPGALTYIVFFIYLLRLRNFFDSRFVANAMVVSICSCFFMVSFFSVARGYGMSLAFLTASIYYLFVHLQKATKTTLLLILLFVALTIWSNLSMIFCSIIILLIVLGDILRKFKSFNLKERILRLLLIVVIGGSPLYLAISFSFLLKDSGALWLGTQDGFFKAIVLNLPYRVFDASLYGAWLFIAWLLLSVVFVLFHLKKIKLTEKLIIIWGLFFGSICATILLHHIFKVNYPANRAALHLLILGFLAFFTLMDFAKGRWKYITIYPVAIFLGHMLFTANFSFIPLWQKFTIDDIIYDQLRARQNKEKEMLTISGPYYTTVTCEFFSRKNPSQISYIQPWDYPSEVADLVVAYEEDPIPYSEELDTLFFDERTQISFLERRNKYRWLEHAQGEKRKISSSEQIIPLEKFEINGINDAPFKVDLELDLTTQTELFYAALMVNIESADKENLHSEFIYLDRQAESYDETVRFKTALYFESGYPKDAIVNAYIWNEDKIAWEIDVRKLKLSRSER